MCYFTKIKGNYNIITVGVTATRRDNNIRKMVFLFLWHYRTCPIAAIKLKYNIIVHELIYER